MGFLAGKRALIVGRGDRAFDRLGHRAGDASRRRRTGLHLLNDKMKERVEPLAAVARLEASCCRWT